MAVTLDAITKSLADLGGISMPLFVALADWVAQKFYSGVLRGAGIVGFSYSDNIKRRQ
jgi:hypothetical protein